MKYAVFVNTPAHAHLYRNAVRELRERGHEVSVLARDYGCTIDLLEYYDVPYTSYGSCGNTKHSLIRNLPLHYTRIARFVREFGPDLIFGMGGYSAHGGAISGTRTVLLLDSEPTTLDQLVSRPFAELILTPATFRKHLGPKHYVFDGFKETAYLHPEVFTRDPSVRDELGVGDDRFAVVRFNAFGSHHDVAEGGFSPTQRRRLVTRLADEVTVFVSDEAGELDFDAVPARPFDAHPARLHDALAEASLLVADTQTMVTEAAILGTPAIRSNSFVGESDMGNFVELAERDLIHNLRDFDTVLETARDLLRTDGTEEAWQRRRAEYLRGKVNLTDVIVDVAIDPDGVDRFDTLSKRSKA